MIESFKEKKKWNFLPAEEQKRQKMDFSHAAGGLGYRSGDSQDFTSFVVAMQRPDLFPNPPTHLVDCKIIIKPRPVNLIIYVLTLTVYKIYMHLLYT